jgi:hypothetical protein
MKFKKLFQLLVVSGAVIGTQQGCSNANAQTKDRKADAGSAAPADAGSGGGVQGW